MSTLWDRPKRHEVRVLCPQLIVGCWLFTLRAVPAETGCFSPCNVHWMNDFWTRIQGHLLGEAVLTVGGESAGRCALLRVPRPSASSFTYAKRITRLILRAFWVRWQGNSEIGLVGCGVNGCMPFAAEVPTQSARHGDWAMRPGFGVKGARRQPLAYNSVSFACVFTPKPHAHRPVAGPGLKRRVGFDERPGWFQAATSV